jgi:hypothetical protein
MAQGFLPTVHVAGPSELALHAAMAQFTYLLKRMEEKKK